MSSRKTVAVVGLGYVGLPLAVSLSNRRKVIGFDVDHARINDLRKGIDHTGEISSQKLGASTLQVTDELADIKEASIYIVAVPTPVDAQNKPDLTALEKASKTVSSVLCKGDIVVFESTVYPGVTENICGKILEENSGLKCGQDFHLGYSPERINPGDKVHTVESITKIVSAQNPHTAEELKDLYGSMNGGNIFIAASIQVAEAAKVIENAQRDINIAFMNEISQIFTKLNLSTFDVLEAASTKWNFLPFTPGLVGGHCIGVDPFYLAECARQINHYPQIILAGRSTNDSMPHHFADQLYQTMTSRFAQPGKLLVLGLTFKENVPDLRNTKVADLIMSLKNKGYQMDVVDPRADPKEAMDFYNIALIKEKDLKNRAYQGIVLAVSHEEFKEFKPTFLKTILDKDGMVFDLKGFWRHTKISEEIPYWTL